VTERPRDALNRWPGSGYPSPTIIYELPTKYIGQVLEIIARREDLVNRGEDEGAGKVFEIALVRRLPGLAWESVEKR